MTEFNLIREYIEPALPLKDVLLIACVWLLAMGAIAAGLFLR